MIMQIESQIYQSYVGAKISCGYHILKQSANSDQMTGSEVRDRIGEVVIAHRPT